MSIDDLTRANDSSPRATRIRSMEKLILVNGSVSIADLAQTFNVSVMTVHRDLEMLERSGTVRRVRGAATALSSNLLESHIRYRQSANLPIKRRLAAAAVAMVEPGHAVMLDDSTTAAMMFDDLSKVKPLTVISNSVTCMINFAPMAEIRFIVLGGEYNARYAATVGLTTERNIHSLHPNFVFMSASAARGNGIYHPDESIVQVKQAMIQAANKAVLLIDSTKFHNDSLYRVCDLTDFHRVIVDSEIHPDLVKELRADGVQLQIVT